MARRRRRALSSAQAVTTSTSTKPSISDAKPVAVNQQVAPAQNAAHPDQHYVEGVRNPTIDPFMRPEDMMAFADARAQYEQSLYDIDYELAKAAADTAYEKDQTAKQALLRSRDSRDDFAARGLAQASVRDADLFDIDATAALRRQFLDTELNTLRLRGQGMKTSIQTNWDTWMTGLNQQMVANAAEAAHDMPEWKTPPHWEANKPPQAVENTPIRNPSLIIRTGGETTNQPRVVANTPLKLIQQKPARGGKPGRARPYTRRPPRRPGVTGG